MLNHSGPLNLEAKLIQMDIDIHVGGIKRDLMLYGTGYRFRF